MPYLGLDTYGVRISLVFWLVPAVVVVGGCFGASALGRTPLGDMNCDGSIDFADINPFVMALSDPNALRAQVGDWCFEKEQADCNFDGVVDFADIDPFVDFIMGTAVPPDRPMKIYVRPAEPPQRKDTQMSSCKKMACGHPECCVVSSREGTNYCGWCEAEARAKHAEEMSEYWRHRCIDMQAKLARIAQESTERDTPTESFREYLEKNRNIVRTWPEWVQTLLGKPVKPVKVPDALGDADHS